MSEDFLDFDGPTPTVETDGITTTITEMTNNETGANPDIVGDGHSLLDSLGNAHNESSATTGETVPSTSSNGLDLISGATTTGVVVVDTETETPPVVSSEQFNDEPFQPANNSSSSEHATVVLDDQTSTTLLDFGRPPVISSSDTSANVLETPGVWEAQTQSNTLHQQNDLLDLMTDPSPPTATTTDVDIWSGTNPTQGILTSDPSLNNEVDLFAAFNNDTDGTNQDIEQSIPAPKSTIHQNGNHDRFVVVNQPSVEPQSPTIELLSEPFKTVSNGDSINDAGNVSLDVAVPTTKSETTMIGSDPDPSIPATTKLDGTPVDVDADIPPKSSNTVNGNVQEVTMGRSPTGSTNNETLDQNDVDHATDGLSHVATVMVDTTQSSGDDSTVQVDPTISNSNIDLPSTTNELIVVDCIDSSKTMMLNGSTSDGPSWLHNQSSTSAVPNDTVTSPEEVTLVVKGGEEEINSQSIPPGASSVEAKVQPAQSSPSPTSINEESTLTISLIPPAGSDNTNNSEPSSLSNVEQDAGGAPASSGPPHHPSVVPEDSVGITERIEFLQKELVAAQTLISEFQRREEDEKKKRPSDEALLELQVNLQNEINLRTETESTARRLQAQYEQLQVEFESSKEESESILRSVKNDLEVLSQEKSILAKEVEQIREERDEQARKEMSLTTRLNAAKKKEALKSNAADHYEDQVDQLEKQVTDYKVQLESMTAERDQLRGELGEWKQYAERRTKQLEAALADEKKLNDERKRKMKGFVEAKTEEVRLAKSDNISLQTELDQTAHSLKELNQRYKQLHAQWVQSQTRNRELQRDVTKMKMDSEKMHKVGGTLEARLSRSAQESEDHKHKRIQAKHELMSVLSQLEAERSVNHRVRESIKMTFTPKALSQQQTIQETMDDLEAALHKLATRLGRPLVPPPTSTVNDLAMEALNGDGSGDLDGEDEGKSSGNTLSDVNTNRVLQKLENETQRVSQSIVALSTSVERLHAMLEGGGNRNCVDALQAILGNRPSEETRSITGVARRAPTRNGPRYGQISGSLA